MARILVIDDENNIRMMIRLALQHAGHFVGTAADGPEGLTRFGNGSEWDLVLLDQRMPGMEGLEVLEELRKRNSHARVIMVTAFGTIDLAVDAMKRGATDFLRKPFTTEVLRGAVAASLENGKTPAPQGTASGPTPIIYSMTTINGFWIEFMPAPADHKGADLQFHFTVRSPMGQMQPCTVTIRGYVLELVRAHADCDRLPGGDRFWQGLCEEALANYLWQNASFPPDGQFVIEHLSTGMKRWIDAVLEGMR